MKITLNKTMELDAVGVGYLLNGSTTIMYHTEETFEVIARQFDSITNIQADRPAVIETYSGNGVLTGIYRNLGSDIASVTIQGLTKTVERRNK